MRGDAAEGDAMLQRLRAQAQTPDSPWAVTLAIAEVYAVRNDPDQAFKWLDLARERFEHARVRLPRSQLKRSLQITPFFESLQADRRWGELLASLDVQ
jgi:hypothetical protein